MSNIFLWLKATTALILVLCSFTGLTKDRHLYIYNWSSYIAPDTIINFEKQTGIKVVYDVFDSNEVLESKLMAGNTGFDLVVPSDSFLERQAKVGIFTPLDKSQLPNYQNLDENLLKMLAKHDPDNRYAIPYMWLTTGIGYNVDQVKKTLGDDAPVDSWDLVLNPDNLQKLSRCGVAFLDAPTEIFPTVLNYLGLDPNSQNPDDYKKATEHLSKLRPFVTYFHSSKFINDLANGDICVAIGWSGDIMQAIAAAKEANNNVNVKYYIPKEGAIAYFDVFAIPKDAENIDEAYAFLNYLMEPQVIADISNHVFYANAVTTAGPYLDDQIKNNSAIYPDAATMDKLFSLQIMSPKIEKLMTRSWTKVLTDR
ncbi:spermidine/putrescine-binding protein [Orbus hercynius]|uniref:Putrescine-binding periplasmic protein n=1 Tax=Orbus hercynius TaxID=593135 RepID=A0A495RBR6_9GAMM|nr:extracellular solute-binding protein [Orbus hercynius]RKS84624.1 spermidine/putrescine-binding protein [Orbus hercynius]